MASVDEILEAALALDEQQRQLVADLLWGSVDATSHLPHDDAQRAEITAELRETWNAYQSGHEAAHPWTELKQRLLQDRDGE